MQVDDALVPVRIDLQRVELLDLVPHADQHVCRVEAEVGVVVAHKAHSTQCVRVVVREDALSVEGGRHRYVQPFGKSQQGRGSACPGSTMTGEHHRMLRRCDDLSGAGDLRRRRRIRVDRIDLQGSEGCPGARGLDVLRDGEEHRPGTLALRGLERLAHHLGNRFGTLHPRRPLGDRGEHGHQVDDLVGLHVRDAGPAAAEFAALRPLPHRALGQRNSKDPLKTRLVRLLFHGMETPAVAATSRPHRARGPVAPVVTSDRVTVESTLGRRDGSRVGLNIPDIPGCGFVVVTADTINQHPRPGERLRRLPEWPRKADRRYWTCDGPARVRGAW